MINTLVEAYRAERSEEVFRKIYDHFNAEWSPMYRKIAASLRCDIADVQSTYSLVLYRTLISYKGGTSYTSYLRSALKKERSKLYNKSKRKAAHEQVVYIRSSEDDASTSEIASDFDLQDHVNDRMYKKKEPDKRQLVEFLCDPAKVDSVTTAIVTNFPQYPSITALAKALGLHHEVVRRKLRALSRRHDVNRFGDAADYLAV